MTREEKQKAIDALKISAPIMAITQEEFADYIQTLNKIMDWLEQEPVIYPQVDGITPTVVRQDRARMDAVVDNGLQDLIDELREYGIARKGELAGMVLEAANRLEWLAEERDQMAELIVKVGDRLEKIQSMIEDLACGEDLRQ